MTTVADPPLFTAEQFLRMGDDAKGFELIDGRLEELHMSAKAIRVAGRLFYRLEAYSEQNGGWAFPQESPFQCFGGKTVRKPDAAFIVTARYTAEQSDTEGFVTVCPDVVAEVISPNDLASKSDAKIEQWLRAGVHIVWVIDPDLRLVYVHTMDKLSKLREADTLTAEPVLPGFAVPVADLFKLPGA